VEEVEEVEQVEQVEKYNELISATGCDSCNLPIRPVVSNRHSESQLVASRWRHQAGELAGPIESQPVARTSWLYFSTFPLFHFSTYFSLFHFFRLR
jgi:hypothetical protein